MYKHWISCTLIVLCTTFGFAQKSKAINGNGKITTQVRPMKMFSALKLNFPAYMVVTCQTMPGLTIETDENILPFIQTEIKGNTLSITQDGWIEPTKVKILVGTSFLSSIETGGYGTIELKDIETPNLHIHNPVGTLKASGKVKSLEISSNTGKTDASQLIAQEVKVNLSSWGEVQVNAVQLLETNIAGRGKVIHHNTPQKIIRHDATEKQVRSLQDEKRASKPAVSYISLSLYNNKLKKTSIRFEGPDEAPFGYGVAFVPYGTKNERLPLGTKIYQQSPNGKETLLITIKAADEKQKVSLFSTQNEN